MKKVGVEQNHAVLRVRHHHFPAIAFGKEASYPRLIGVVGLEIPIERRLLPIDDEPAGLPFAGLTKPLVGAVNGPAVTGGFELALACDFLIASERASFADTHARVGVMPGWGLTVFLPQAIGIRRARQMSFTGNYIDAQTALDWGLVNMVVPHGELVSAARSLAADMGTIPPANLAAIKQAYVAANDPVDGPAIAAESAYNRSWSFDRGALAENREAIQARGSSQAT